MELEIKQISNMWETMPPDMQEKVAEAFASQMVEKIYKDVTDRLGMFVDLSHVSQNVMRDALQVSVAPVIFSHSSARGVHYAPRNIPDDVLFSLVGTNVKYLFKV